MPGNPPPDPNFTFRGHESAVTALCFNENEKELVSGSETGEITIWSLLDMRPKHKWALEAYGQPHNSILEIIYHQNLLITQSRNGFVNVWEIVNDKYVAKESYPVSTLSFCQIDYYIDDLHSYLALPNHKNPSKIDLLNLNNKETELSIDSGIAKKLGTIMCYKLIKNKEEFHLICGHEIGKIALWNFANGELISELNIYNTETEPILCLEFDGINKGACGSINNKLVVWQLQENKLNVTKEVEVLNPTVSVVTVRKTTETLKPILCAGCKDGRIRIYSWKTLKPLAVLNFHTDGITSAKFCSKTGFLAVGSKDKKITLWSLYT